MRIMQALLEVTLPPSMLEHNETLQTMLSEDPFSDKRHDAELVDVLVANVAESICAQNNVVCRRLVSGQDRDF